MQLKDPFQATEAPGRCERAHARPDKAHPRPERGPQNIKWAKNHQFSLFGSGPTLPGIPSMAHFHGRRHRGDGGTRPHSPKVEGDVPPEIVIF